MKVLAVSDAVVDHIYQPDVRQRFPGVELLVGCGDLPYYFLEFLISTFDVPLVYVLGNHDAGPQHLSDGRILRTVQGGVDLHGRVTCVNGLVVAGLQGSMRYLPRAPLMYTENEMRWQLLWLLPRLVRAQRAYGRPLDLLVTHSPPYGIHDDQDQAHTGFKVFLTLMRAFKPRYLLHGHVHKRGQGVTHATRYEETTVVNVYPFRLLDV